jgi:chorismate-pyruvate lyase
VHGLKLKNQEEWWAYAKSEKKPRDIPNAPHSTYADAGWAGYGDWLGTGRRAPGDWRPFKAARTFVRGLKLKSRKEWTAYCKSGKKTQDIPTAARSIYADAGWVSWGDWLGTEREWRSFKDARAFARSLKLKNTTEWKVYAASGKKPRDIPTAANKVYADAGWAGWGDWLAAGHRKGGWRPFKDARAFVRGLKLKNISEWSVYARSEKRPHDIPKSPNAVYADAGWVSWGDWLGTGPRRGSWRPFKDARAFVRGLKLKNSEEWTACARSGKRPHDIPARPNAVYADAGWVSWGDWLGNERSEWRSFKDARAFVRHLKLKSSNEWRVYAKSKKRPQDIPASPHTVYADAGWVSWGDWLGTEREWRSFKDARAFVRGLKLKSQMEWWAYAKSGKKPHDIPSDPTRVYADAGWVSWGDWLGSKRRIGGWRPFKAARAFARALKLKSQTEWWAYARSEKKPPDIPNAPYSRYADAGWVSWGDWLGTKRRIGGWRPFRDARAFVRGLKLKSQMEWFVYVKSGKRPDDIPSNPQMVYADAGWVSWGDWLGTEHEWRSFEDARAFVRGLKLKNISEWSIYARSKKRPHDIPKSPHAVYADAGWVSWGDWLGTEHAWRSFKDARAFVRHLKLKSSNEWRVYARSKKRPHDIPASPHTVYADAGWVSWGDWLGNERSEWRSFKDARAFVRHLKLKSQTEWWAYAKSGKKPHDIPASPGGVYADAGWVSWGDWLGTGRRAPGDWRPFKAARAFVRGLKLKNQMEWIVYAKSGKKPDDIPSSPEKAYADAGWVSWGDWLGTGRERRRLAFAPGLKLKSHRERKAYATPTLQSAQGAR